MAYLLKVIIKFKRYVSSANISHNEFIPSGRSFMYIINNSGPSTDPCGIPDIILPAQIFDHFKQLFVLNFQDSF